MASEVRRMVGCRVSAVSHDKVPGRAMRRSTRLEKALMPRAMKKIETATARPGMARRMPLTR
ncbi:hypothetical protein D3C73_1285860 [compost metagenome]